MKDLTEFSFDSHIVVYKMQCDMECDELPGVPDIPVPGVLLKRSDDAVEVDELIQLCDVIPGSVGQPTCARVIHLILSVDHLCNHK